MSENANNQDQDDEDDSTSEFEMGSSSSEDSDADDDSSSDERGQQDRRPQRKEQAANPEAKSDTALAPPTFSLTDDAGRPLDPNRYELWSLRLPASLPVTALENCELAIPDSPGVGFVPGGPILTSMEATSSRPVTFQTEKGEFFSLRWGNKVENESFRLLVPTSKNQNQASSDSDESDDDDDTVKGNQSLSLTPTNSPFQRHINVVSYVEELVATKVAPGVDRAPKPDPKSAVATSGPFTKLRKAYQPVPQKQGLKRRWMPLGTDGGVDPAAARPRSFSGSSSHISLLGSSRASHKRPPAVVVKRNADDDSPNDNAMHPSGKRKRSVPENSQSATSPGQPMDGNPVKRGRSSSNNGVSEIVQKSTIQDSLMGTTPKKNGEKQLSKAERKAMKAERKAMKAERKEAKKQRKEKKIKKENK